LKSFNGLLIEELGVLFQGRFFGVELRFLRSLKKLKEIILIRKIRFNDSSLERVVKIVAQMAFLIERLAYVLCSKIDSLGMDKS
jgi:hypothetical protein